WAKRCIVLTSATLKAKEPNNDEELHPLEALGHFICSQSLSMSTLDYGKNDKWAKLFYSVAHANIKQLCGEEDEKLEAIDKGSIEKALSYVDDTLGFLERQKRKYCEAIETTPIEETPPLVYLNKNRKLTNSVDLNDERNKTELRFYNNGKVWVTRYTNLYNGSKVSNQEESTERSVLSKDILAS
ncbi:hypothetical protein INT47_007223, partial [Mucor saturninus]